MKVTTLVVGRSRGTLEPAIREFETRAGRYWRMEVLEVASGAGGSEDRERVQHAEAERLRARIPEDGELWILTRTGKGMSSSRLARELEHRMTSGLRSLTFVIGGAWGVDPGLEREAAQAFSLSRMTLPHAFARLLLAEQLYRAGTILRGEPYHKGVDG